MFTFCLLIIFGQPTSSYRMAIEHPIEIMDGGSIERVIELSKIWRDKVLLKSEYILDVEMLLEKKRPNRYLLLVIYHYQNRDGAKSAAESIGPLIEKAWPIEEERQAFFKELQSYIVQEGKVTHRFDVIK